MQLNNIKAKAESFTQLTSAYSSYTLLNDIAQLQTLKNRFVNV